VRLILDKFHFYLGGSTGSAPAYSVEVSPAACPSSGPLARARAARATLESLLAEVDELEGRLD